MSIIYQYWNFIHSNIPSRVLNIFLLIIVHTVSRKLFFIRDLVKTTTYILEQDPPCLGKGVIQDTTYLLKITDTILLAFKFELTLEYSASKSSHY